MGLKLIQKATASSTEASLLASHADLVASLINLAIADGSTEVSALATSVLLSLLRVDRTGPEGQGEGLMWRRVFKDKDIYSKFYNLCSWRSKTPSMTRADKTLAQARLLVMIPEMAEMNWDMITTSHFPQIEAQYEGSGANGLISFVEGMVEMETDVLMYMTMIDFYATFILCRPTLLGNKGYSTSKGLEHLVASGRHDATMDLYVKPAEEQADQFTASFLTSRSARYTAVYATNFPIHLQSYKDYLPRAITAIQSYLPPPNSRDPHSPSLHLLASLPPSSVSSIITNLPLNHPEYIATLSILLPADEHLYRKYLDSCPPFYKKLVEIASVVALKESALASLQLLLNLSRTTFGLHDILNTTTVMEYVVTVPQKFTVNLGGGGEESAAYLVAQKRLEIVESLARGLATGGQELDGPRKAWGRVVQERSQSGVWGGIGGGNDAGSRVGWEGM